VASAFKPAVPTGAPDAVEAGELEPDGVVELDQADLAERAEAAAEPQRGEVLEQTAGRELPQPSLFAGAAAPAPAPAPAERRWGRGGTPPPAFWDGERRGT